MYVEVERQAVSGTWIRTTALDAPRPGEAGRAGSFDDLIRHLRIAESDPVGARPESLCPNGLDEIRPRRCAKPPAATEHAAQALPAGGEES